MVKMRGEVNSY